MVGEQQVREPSRSVLSGRKDALSRTFVMNGKGRLFATQQSNQALQVAGAARLIRNRCFMRWRAPHSARTDASPTGESPAPER